MASDSFWGITEEQMANFEDNMLNGGGYTCKTRSRGGRGGGGGGLTYVDAELKLDDLQGATIIAMDTEFRFGGSKALTEFGFVVLKITDEVITTIRQNPKSYLPEQASASHYIIRSHKGYIAPKPAYRKQDAFAFGDAKSEVLSQPQISERVQTSMQGSTKIVALGHAIENERTALSTNDINLGNVWENQLDTQHMYASQGIGGRPGLATLTEYVLRMNKTLVHNVGNDAVLTLLLFLQKVREVILRQWYIPPDRIYPVRW